MARTRRTTRPAFGDERAVSTVVGYSIGLGIATLLITGLLVGAGGVIQDQRESTTRTELRVVGHQLVADIRAADTLVRTASGTPGEVWLRQDLPENTAAGGYTVAVNPSGCGCVVLSTSTPEVQVRVAVETDTTLASTRFTGGDVLVEYVSGGGGTLEVSEAHD